MMQYFIGTKILKARAMTRGEYNEYRGWDLPANEKPEDEGYLVEYLDGGEANHPGHAGYISWSPKDVFEKSYIGMDCSMEHPDYVLRLMGERAELADRLAKLKAFLNLQTALHSDDEDVDTAQRERLKNVPKLEQVEWRMLMEQSMLMTSLLAILDRRVRYITNKASEAPVVESKVGDTPYPTV